MNYIDCQHECTVQIKGQHRGAASLRSKDVGGLITYVLHKKWPKFIQETLCCRN